MRPEPVREHPRHPHRVPAVRRPGGVHDPRDDRRDRGADLGRLRRLRAVRARRPPRRRGGHRQREVRVQAARLRRRRDARAARSRSTSASSTRIRAAHPALGQLRNLRFHASDDDSVLVYSKHLDGRFTPDGRDDTVIVVANVDPHSVQGDHRAPRSRRHRPRPRHPLRGRGPRDRASLGLGRRQLRAPRRVHEARAHPPRRCEAPHD